MNFSEEKAVAFFDNGGDGQSDGGLLEEVIGLFNLTKKFYALSEEKTDGLNTNLQPLNEYRAALDHVIRMLAFQYLDEYKNGDPLDELKKVRSHLRRAFFDVADSLSTEFRNEICSTLSVYHSETIRAGIPDYYLHIKPEIEKLGEQIAELRTTRRAYPQTGAADMPEEVERDVFDEYFEIVNALREFAETVRSAIPSLEELHSDRVEHESQERRHRRVENGIAIAGVVLGVIIGIIGWLL